MLVLSFEIELVAVCAVRRMWMNFCTALGLHYLIGRIVCNSSEIFIWYFLAISEISIPTTFLNSDNVVVNLSNQDFLGRNVNI